ncbi:transmembrane protein 26-like isoform X1 [Asterias amurensis]|uniref:transmembrane protein 26-like isoform X1 n=1 Tax=Asterias amurensis TaxID=7602 RepID=UPI003AB33A30
MAEQANAENTQKAGMNRMTVFFMFLVRFSFFIHGIFTVKQVSDVKSNPLYWLLIIPVGGLLFEFILTLIFTDDGESKWFRSSVFLYLSSVVPGIWILNFDIYEKRIAFRDSMGWEDCSMDTAYNESSLSADVAGIAPQSHESLIPAPEQWLMFLLLLGRWLLPKGALTRDQLSQILLMYIGMAVDILEFSFETLKEEKVICNLVVIILIMGIWSLTLLQFGLVHTSMSAPDLRAAETSGGKFCKGCLGCCENDIWAWFTIVMQDGPCLGMRLYLLIEIKITNQMMLLFTIKNILVIFFMLKCILFKDYPVTKKCSSCGHENTVKKTVSVEVQTVTTDTSTNTETPIQEIKPSTQTMKQNSPLDTLKDPSSRKPFTVKVNTWTNT